MKGNSQKIKIKLNEKTEKRTQLIQARHEISRGGVEVSQTAEEKTGSNSLARVKCRVLKGHKETQGIWNKG